MRQRIDGSALRTSRICAGYSSVEALAAEVGWGKSQIYRIEQGRRRASRELYEAILAALDLAEGDLLLEPGSERAT